VQLTWLPVEIGLFDVVVVNMSFLKRALNANAWLARFIGDILTPNGSLVIADTEEQVEAAASVLGSRSLKLTSKTTIAPAPCDTGAAVVTVWRQ
jgi:hypothetical protein